MSGPGLREPAAGGPGSTGAGANERGVTGPGSTEPDSSARSVTGPGVAGPGSNGSGAAAARGLDLAALLRTGRGEYVGLGILLVAVLVLFGWTTPRFLSLATFQSMAFQMPGELGSSPSRC